jgi:hypothetical protein
VWKTKVGFIFSQLLCLTYKLPSPQPFVGGVYSPSAPLTVDVAAGLFHHILGAVDISVAKVMPRCLLEVFSAVSQMVKATVNCVPAMGIFRPKFSGSGFLKLTGHILTSSLKLQPPYDTAIAVNMDALISIVSSFEPHGAEAAFRGLLALIICFCRPDLELTRTTAVFLNRGIDLFSGNEVALPLLATTALSAIPQLSPDHLPDVPEQSLLEATIALFISASDVLTNCEAGNGTAIIEEAYSYLWDLSPHTKARFQLLCYSVAMPTPICEKVVEYFAQKFVSMLLSSTEHILEFMIGCIQFIGAVAVVRKDAPEVILRLGIVPMVLKAVSSLDLPHSIPEYGRIVVTTLKMLSHLAEWTTDIFKDPINSRAFFDFHEYLTKAVKLRHLDGDSKRPESTSDMSPRWFDKYQSAIGSLLSHITARLFLNLPALDHFSRRLDSSHEINEDQICKKLGLSGMKTYYYSVGKSLLVSFIEKKNASGPHVILARGPFGRTIWTVKEKLQEKLPEFSKELLKVALPVPKGVVSNPIPVFGEAKSDFPLIPMSELLKQDAAVRNVFSSDYGTWLNWEKFAFHCPSQNHALFQRPRVIDFLAELGLLDCYNKAHIRAFKRKDVEKAIHDFDRLESVRIVPVAVSHILPTDKSLDTEVSRMTPLLQKFIKAMGEPVKISEPAARSHGIPSVRTAVPVIPYSGGWSAVITAAMLRNPKEFSCIKEAAKVIILFNETGFELQEVKHQDKPVLVIKPLSNGMYFVRLHNVPENVIPPFAEKQLLSGKTLSFNLALLVDMLDEVDELAYTKRAKAWSALMSEPCSKTFGPLACGAFVSD